MSQHQPAVAAGHLVPTAGQLAWQQTGLGVFFHFGLNTFHGVEWSDGTLDPATFAPDRLDAGQWVRTAKQAGAGYVVLTAKHHDGFCLWPTETTDYSVRSAPWRGGRGDVVGEVADACRRQDVGLGLYLSPWDRNAPCYPDPAAYDEFYLTQLEEVCTNYGDIFELWFDGAGSQGRTYDWERIAALIDRTQPRAMVFNMGRPTIRWIGNEDGLATDPVRYVVDSTKLDNYTTVTVDLADQHYLPPECDVSVRKGWFHHPEEQPKTLEHLLAIYYRSIGLGANLLLNLPPDRHGLIPDADVARVAEWRAELDRRFAQPVHGRITTDPDHAGTGDTGSSSGSAGSATSPSSMPSSPPGDGPVFDGRSDPEQVGAAGGDVRVDFGGPVEMDHLMLCEDLSGGQQVEHHQIFADDGGLLAEGGTIGTRRIHVCGPVRTPKLRIRLRGAGDILDASCLTAVTGYRTGSNTRPQLPTDYRAPTEAPL